jgi:hypothetical protein
MTSKNPFGENVTAGKTASDPAARLGNSPADERELTDEEIAAVAAGAGQPIPPAKPGDVKKM